MFFLNFNIFKVIKIWHIYVLVIVLVNFGCINLRKKSNGELEGSESGKVIKYRERVLKVWG